MDYNTPTAANAGTASLIPSDWMSQTWATSDWSNSFYPPALDELFAVEAEKVAPGITQTAQNIATDGETWVESITRALNQLVMTKAQRDLLEVNITRAEQGLPPLDLTRYSGAVINPATGVPTPVPAAQAGPSPLVLLALGVGALALLRR